jgi:hypothetical protein
MYSLFKKKRPKKELTQEELDKALEENRRAADRLKKTIERLGPMQGAAKFLGGDS